MTVEEKEEKAVKQAGKWFRTRSLKAGISPTGRDNLELQLGFILQKS